VGIARIMGGMVNSTQIDSTFASGLALRSTMSPSVISSDNLTKNQCLCSHLGGVRSEFIVAVWGCLGENAVNATL